MQRILRFNRFSRQGGAVFLTTAHTQETPRPLLFLTRKKFHPLGVSADVLSLVRKSLFCVKRAFLFDIFDNKKKVARGVVA